MIRIAIVGVTGRMGRALIRAAAEMPDVRISGGVASRASRHSGSDIAGLADLGACGVLVTSDLAQTLAHSDVVIDFSNADAAAATLRACRAARKPLVIGTTELPAELDHELAGAAGEIAVLVAPNTSIGVTLLIELVRASAKNLPRDFDIEILDVHHRSKRDAPSGTALALGRAAAEARGQSFDAAAVTTRAGAAAGTQGTRSERARGEGEIGFAALRGGDVVGDHTVVFAGTGEQLILGHRATDRAIFARGALRAAIWLAGQPPARYAMRDVVGYKTGT